jgi:hypothetical protein
VIDDLPGWRTQRVPSFLVAAAIGFDLRSQSKPWQEQSSESQQVELEHRPPILLIPAAPGATAGFSEFAPNRFTVAVRSPVTALPGPGRRALDPEGQPAHRGGNQWVPKTRVRKMQKLRVQNGAVRSLPVRGLDGYVHPGLAAGTFLA